MPGACWTAKSSEHRPPGQSLSRPTYQHDVNMRVGQPPAAPPTPKTIKSRQFRVTPWVKANSFSSGEGRACDGVIGCRVERHPGSEHRHEGARRFRWPTARGLASRGNDWLTLVLLRVAA